MAYFEDGDGFLPIQNKINALASLFKLSQTDGAISAATITSITIDAIAAGSSTIVAFSGQPICIVDALTGEQINAILADDWEKGDTTLTIESYELLIDLSDDSFIFIPFLDVTTYSFNS